MEKEIQTECSEILSLELQMTVSCSGIKQNISYDHKTTNYKLRTYDFYSPTVYKSDECIALTVFTTSLQNKHSKKIE